LIIPSKIFNTFPPYIYGGLTFLFGVVEVPKKFNQLCMGFDSSINTTLNPQPLSTIKDTSLVKQNTIDLKYQNEFGILILKNENIKQCKSWNKKSCKKMKVWMSQKVNKNVNQI